MVGWGLEKVRKMTDGTWRTKFRGTDVSASPEPRDSFLFCYTSNFRLQHEPGAWARHFNLQRGYLAQTGSSMKGEVTYGERVSDTADFLTKGNDEVHIELLEQDYAEQGEAIKPFRRRRTRKARSMWLVAGLLAAAVFLVWTWYLRPKWGEEWEYRQGFLASKNETFEVARHKKFDGIKIQDLDPALVPGGESDPDGERRLIFVGDIHGCADELKHLLKKVDFDEKKDHFVAVGDVISKGPKNAEVVDELIRIGASSVRGNHEDHILELAPSSLDIDDAPDLEIERHKGKASDIALLKKLSKHHLRYLRDMPLILRIPPLPQAAKSTTKDSSPIAEEILVVHAGLVPALRLEKQDPYFVMNMRSIRWKTHVPLVEAKDKKKKSKPWHKIWEWYNDRVFRRKSLKGFVMWDDEVEDDAPDEVSEAGWFDRLFPEARKKHWPKPQVVVYGHHSKAGLKISRWSKGLDTGCVKGERLTAMVLDAKGGHELVSVKCKDHT